MKKIVAWGLLYLALAIAAVAANPLNGQTVGPFDLLASTPGWNPDGAQVQVRHWERSDIIDGLLPAWLEARRQLRQGHLPLWNPLPAGGTPAMLDSMSAELTPGFLLFALAPDPAFGFYLTVLFCLVAAGLGMHLLVSRYCGWWCALFAGISYMLCGFITAWLFWPHTHTAIWIPWLLLAVDYFGAKGSHRGYVGIAVATALMVVAGFPFVAAMGIGAALVHVAVVGAWRGRLVEGLRASSAVVTSMLLGLMLISIPLLTFSASLEDADLAYRGGGSAFSIADWRLLLGPWLGVSPRVESNMYVGLAALLLFPIGSVWGVVRRSPLAASGIVFVLVGILLVFGVLPNEIGDRLPVLSNNAWHRAILLLDIGLVLLAALGLQALTSFKGQKVLWMSFGTFVCIIQYVDLRTQFLRFNGPVPARYFYPERPALAYLKQHLKPMEHAAVDNGGYLISGTQGGAGIPDWYAHAFRSEPLRRLLSQMADSPFTSPTATAISIDQYHWKEGLLDEMGICYALYPQSRDIPPPAIKGEGTAKQALPPINGIFVKQPLQPGADVVTSAVSVRLATYHAVDADGALELDLLTGSGGELAGSTLAAKDIRDNQMAIFRFEKPVVLHAGEKYQFQLKYSPGAKRRNLTAWYFSDAVGQVSHGDQKVSGQLDYVIHDANGRPSMRDGLQEVFRDEAIVVAENPQCSAGPYWIRGLAGEGGTRTTEKVVMKEYFPSDFSLMVESDEPGYVVLPMRLLPGWRASLNGEEADIEEFREVLPAIAVPGGVVTIRMWYQPPYWRVGALLTILALIVLGFVLGAGRGAKKQHESNLGR